MQVIAKVLDVETRSHKDKMVADVSIKSGGSIIAFTLWSAEVQKGTHAALTKMLGKKTVIDLNVELFNGRLNYGYGFGNGSIVEFIEPKAGI